MTEKTVEHRATHIKEAVAHYKEHDIYLDRNMTFCAVGPLVDDLAGYGRGTSSLQQAKEAIDEAFREKAREAKTSETLALSVITEEGKELKIRGLHSNTGEMLFTPPQKETRAVYAPAPWVAELLAERSRLQKQLDKINKDLQRVRISVYGRGRIHPERYDEKIEDLQTTYANALAAASQPPKT